jgi:24-methylenesterol C-methyltransferase
VGSDLALLLMMLQGLKDVHQMLMDVATSLVKGGETGVFTPMHFLVFKKPLA